MDRSIHGADRCAEAPAVGSGGGMMGSLLYLGRGVEVQGPEPCVEHRGALGG